ncbi:MAG: GNAT family N-acetyltransferase, partial [Rhodobacterales bacterium]|nr:GNAT family N-acetyltransferase [Rhodobacterales bacterium]
MKDIRATPLLVKGRLRVRPASGPGDLDRLLALRALCFRGAATGDDRDNFDAACDHILIEDMAQDSLLGGFRQRRFDGAAIIHSYSAQFYDLAALAAFPAPMLELGRFCLHPGAPDADVLRLAWAAITRQVDCGGVGLLFGCSSFAGCDAARHGDAFALLRDRHGAPARWAPGIKAGEVVRFASLSPAG